MKIPLRLVIDTNVVLDLLHFKRESVEPIGALIQRGDALCFTCPRTLGELSHVIAREHFHMTPESADALMSAYRALSIETANPPPQPQLPQCRDGADQKFIELAFSIGADYLLTRDKALLKLKKRMDRTTGLKIRLPEAFSD